MKCPALSATRVNSWLTCGLKYKFSYHSDLPRKDSIFFKLGKAVHSALEFAGKMYKFEPFSKEEYHLIADRFLEEAAKERIDEIELLKDGKDMVINKAHDFQFGRKTLSLEKFFRTKTDGGIPLIGAIDRIVEIDDNTIGIIDYKTSKFAMSGAELRSDVQLSMYDLVAKIMYPDYKKRVLVMDYLRSKPVLSYRSDEEREEFTKFISQIYQSILDTHEDDLKPSLNKFCSNCDYRSYCPAYTQVLGAADQNYVAAELLNNTELITEWEDVKNRKKVLEERERELKMIVADRIRETGENIQGGGKRLIVRQNSRVMYDREMVFKYVPSADWRKVTTVHKKGLEDYLRNERPDLSKKIRDTATYSFNAPFFVVKDEGGQKDGNQKNQKEKKETG
jgi:RecB family exonuclease